MFVDKIKKTVVMAMSGHLTLISCHLYNRDIFESGMKTTCIGHDLFHNVLFT